jgi:heme O synthase-like polyprenyltransferase
MAACDAATELKLMVAIARHLVTLSKPRVISLLVFTGVCGVYKAADGSPTVVELIAVIVAGTLSAAL